MSSQFVGATATSVTGEPAAASVDQLTPRSTDFQSPFQPADAYITFGSASQIAMFQIVWPGVVSLACVQLTPPFVVRRIELPRIALTPSSCHAATRIVSGFAGSAAIDMYSPYGRP